MRLLILAATSAGKADASDDAWWTEAPWSLILAALVSSAVLLFLIKRFVGRRRPHRVTLADFWWIHESGKIVDDNDPAGPASGFTTSVRIQVKGRRLEGKRNLTNLTLNLRPRFWTFWKWGRWRRGPTKFDLVGTEIDTLRKEGLALGDEDSPLITCEVTEKGEQGGTNSPSG